MGIGTAKDAVNRIPIKDDTLRAVRDVYNMSQGDGGLKTGAINWLLGRLLIPVNKSMNSAGYVRKGENPSMSGLLSMVRNDKLYNMNPNFNIDTSAINTQGWQPQKEPPGLLALLAEASRSGN